MMYSIWLYRFKPGMTEKTLEALRAIGVEKVYPGVQAAGGTFFGRVWGNPKFTHGSVYRRENLASARAEYADRHNLLRLYRLLSSNLAAMELRNLVDRDDAELKALGDDGWHQQMCAPFLEAVEAEPELGHHADVIGLSCMKNNTVPPYTVQALWRKRLGFPLKWLGGNDPRTYFETAKRHKQAQLEPVA